MKEDRAGKWNEKKMLRIWNVFFFSKKKLKKTLLTPEGLAGQVLGGGEGAGPALFTQLDQHGPRFRAAPERYCPLSIQEGCPGVKTGLSATPASLYCFIGENAH